MHLQALLTSCCRFWEAVVAGVDHLILSLVVTQVLETRIGHRKDQSQQMDHRILSVKQDVN